MNKIKALIAIFALSASVTATATTLELTDCSQLSDPHAVLLVHASWCSHCKSFLPVYEQASNEPSMSQYTFYTKQNDHFQSICGHPVYGVPITFTHNMQKSIQGAASLSKLLTFVKQ